MPSHAAKTSLTHPIEVSFLPPSAVPLGGRLGLTFAPGRKGAGLTGNWNRDLDLDLGRIRRYYHADTLVCLMEDGELSKYAMTRLGERCSAFGLRLLRLPIPDVSVPDDPAALVALVNEILDQVADNRTVVVHCRGGIGRTGLVAASCLVALGHDPDEAIKLVRKVRAPNAVETKAQEAVVKNYPDQWKPTGQGHAFQSGWLQPYWPTIEPEDFPTDFGSFATQDPDVHFGVSAWRPASHVPLRSRFRGCLLGGAIGDALGYPVEFMKRKEIAEKVGHERPAKLAYLQGPEAKVSDDTQMTLFTAEGLIRWIHRANRQNAQASMNWVMTRAYLRWLHTQEQKSADKLRLGGGNGWLVTEPRLYHRRAPGNTCLSALHNPQPRADNDSKGCGAVMRVAPIGLASQSREHAFALGNEAGRITHGHPSGYLSGGYLAALVFDLSRGEPISDAMANADALLRTQDNAEEVVRAVEAARVLVARGKPYPKVLEQLGGGWVGEEALAIALACVLSADLSTLEGVADALWLSVAHSGDSDSTGAITGNIIGAIVGVEGLPTWWLQDLELVDVIDRVATDLHAVSVLGRELDMIDYPPH